ncbi:hypothetical protein Zmor_028074 [Zophobas morio]|uniref:Ionotropic glutamate receptor C-terminal domain-containing protein n=1 Tax=Zophobas morio TaxID=2755281 RepID=A0AA38M3V3_9CUCU|nr:hypothetical protein Zmor_028074 [Zophobas morio]
MFQVVAIVAFLINIQQHFAVNLIRENIAPLDQFSPNYLHNDPQTRLVLHFDNTTKDAANFFLTKISTSRKIINYDTATIQPSLKKRGVRYLNLVLLSNPLRFCALCRNIQTTDLIVFFTNPTNFLSVSENVSKLSNLRGSRGVAVVNYAEDVELYNICFYCGDIKVKMTLVQKSSYDQPLDIEFLFSNNFKNFGGHLFKVAYKDYLPYMSCTRKIVVNNITLCEKALGSEFLLLHTLSQHLNFTYQLIEAPSDHYDILVDHVILKHADFAIGGVSVTNRRLKILKFTDVLRFEPFGLLYLSQKSFFSKLFDYELKNLILEMFFLVVMFLLSLLVTLINKWCAGCKLSVEDIFLIFVKSKYEQSANVKTTGSNSTLVIFVSWWIFALIVNVTYRSMLVSMMVQKPMKHDTLQDLVDQGYDIVLRKNTTYMQMFLEAEERLINRSTTLLLDKCEILPYIQTKKALVPIEFTMNLIHNRQSCSTTIDVKKLTKKAISVTPHAWPFRPETPFVDDFNVYIKKHLNGALLKMWENNVLLEKNIFAFPDRTLVKQEKNVIDFEAFVLHFLVYLVLIVVSICCFLFEILYWWWLGRNTKCSNYVL